MDSVVDIFYSHVMWIPDGLNKFPLRMEKWLNREMDSAKTR